MMADGKPTGEHSEFGRMSVAGDVIDAVAATFEEPPGSV